MKISSWKTRSKWLLALTVLCILSLALWGCGQKPEETGETTAPEAKVFKLGVIGPFTGPVAQTGSEFKGAVEMAMAEINSQLGDYKIEIVWIDSQSDPEKASRAYEQAVVKDGVQATIGNWHSSVALALMDISAKYKVPHFFGISLAQSIVDKYNGDPVKYAYWLKGWASTAKMYPGYLQALDEAVKEGWVPRTKIAATYGEDTDLGRDVSKVFVDELKKRGWTVASENYVKVGETDFVPMLTKIRDQDVSLLAGTATSAPSIAAFIKQQDEVGIKALIIADGIGWTGNWYELAGKASDGVLDMSPSWLTPEAKKFAVDFKAKYNFEPSPSAAGTMYDYTRMFLWIAQTTLDKTGTLDKETLFTTSQDMIKNGEMSYKGTVNVEYKFTPESLPEPMVGDGYFMTPVVQYFDGKAKVVWPTANREAPIVIPESAN